MDSETCDVNKTMRVLECKDFSTPDEVYIKAEKLALNDKLEELNEISLFGKDDAIIERRKTIEEEIRVDGISTFTKNYFICQEIIVDEMDYDDCDIIQNSIEIDTEEGLMEKEKITDNFFIQDADPQLEKQSVSDLGKKFPSRLPDKQILTHTEKALLKWNRNHFTSNHKVFNFSAEPEKNIILQSQSKLPNEVNLIKCVDCNFDFRRKVSFRSHSCLSNKENAFKCGYCNKEPNTTGSVPKNAVKRSKTQTYTKEFKCCQCSEIFLLKSSLDKHLLIHKNKKAFECPVCSRKFTRKCNLLAHACKVLKSQEKVQDIPKSKANQPKKVLKKTTFLNFNVQAQNSKSRNKTFGCSECGKKFSAKSQLNRHNRTHSGVKPFECQYCNKGFLRKDYLSEHIRTHTGEKPYKCKQCNVKFVFGTSLSRHIHSVHLKK